MIDITTTYMGLKLEHPVIAASSTFTASLGDMKKLEDAGAAAIIMKSLFEEEILNEISSLSRNTSGASYGQEGDEYLAYYLKESRVDEYLNVIRQARESLSIPVIASINCTSSKGWLEFADRIEEAGAGGLEINILSLPSDPNQRPDDIEKTYLDILRGLRSRLSIPIALKSGFYFTSPAHSLAHICHTGIQGLVLFNRYVDPDIDIHNLEYTTAPVYTSPADLKQSLRWLGILHGQVDCDLAASTGIHDSTDAIKALLAGARALYVVSTLYLNGFEVIGEIRDGIREWMDEKGFSSLDQVVGRMSRKQASDAWKLERTQFLKHFSSHSR